MQETRIAKLLVTLKSRLSPYMAGEEDAFREVQVGVGFQLACVWSTDLRVLKSRHCCIPADALSAIVFESGRGGNSRVVAPSAAHLGTGNSWARACDFSK